MTPEFKAALRRFLRVVVGQGVAAAIAAALANLGILDFSAIAGPTFGPVFVVALGALLNAASKFVRDRFGLDAAVV